MGNLGPRVLIVPGLLVYGLGAALSIVSYLLFGNIVCVGWSCNPIPDVPMLLAGLFLAAGGAYVAVFGLLFGGRREH